MRRTFLNAFFGIFCILYQAMPAYSQTLYSLQELCREANKNAETIKIADDDLFIAQQEKTGLCLF